MTIRVLIAVTHLLGVGHLARAAALARGLRGAGHEVTLVSGGAPAPQLHVFGCRQVQLPPVHIRGTAFSHLLDENEQPISDALRTRRREVLLAALHEAQPDVVVTELFPFGRRALADEFLALIDEARACPHPPAIVASVRDILVAPAKPERVAQAHDRLRAFYDLVLAHGDPAVLPLERSWPLDKAVAPLLRYTGYIDPDEPEPVTGQGDEIVVSGGGSAAALPLFRAAVDAARLFPGKPWRILVGRGVPEADFAALHTSAPPHAVVERSRADFPSLLARAAVSVSQAGYNTVVDVMRARVRAVLVPFEAGNETEQRLRAESFAAMPPVDGAAAPFVVLPEAELSASALVQAVTNALERSAPGRIAIDRNGISRSVALLEEVAHSRDFSRDHEQADAFSPA